MDIFQPPATRDRKYFSWDRAEHYIKEERPLQPTRKIVVKGAVDVVFRRFDSPQLVVAGETAEAVASVKTYYKGDKLVIEQESASISIQSSGVHVNVSGGQVAMGDIINKGGSFHFGSGHSCTSLNTGRVIVGVALPEVRTIAIKGSGDVTLLDLHQAGIDLEIQGSGDIAVFGQVGMLAVKIAGSGDVDASELIADRADLSIAGSGDIEAFVRTEVRARVAGSGDIVVRGNPARRDHSAAGAGKVKFR